jgi:hypothetical protein
MASVLLLLVAIMLHLAYISAQPAPGCKPYCGDVKIPYPFGIGRGCAINGGFELSCNRTADGIEKPLIGNVEVLEISLPHGQTRALNYVSTYCYNGSTGSMDPDTWALDFSSWPYWFSDVHNDFVVIGCNTLAYIYNDNDKTGYTTACASVCASPEAVTNGSCSGIGCCQNAVPKSLNRYDVNFYSVYNVSNSSQFNPCSYAALVETKTFNFRSDYIVTKRFNETYQGRQPMVLEWVIGEETCEVARRNMTSYACLSANSVCVNSTNGPGYLCNCTKGYEGNPYLLDGCTGKLIHFDPRLHEIVQVVFCCNMKIGVNLTIIRSSCTTADTRFLSDNAHGI